MLGSLRSLGALSFLPLGWVTASTYPGVLVLVAYFVTVLLGQGAAVYLAAQMPHVRPRTLREPSDHPRTLSIIVPAMEEEEDLGRLLKDLETQNLPSSYPRPEVIVVVGPSRDRTLQVAQAGKGVSRVISESPLPPGWVGKNWACEEGSRAASGDVLLFLDADVRLSPEALQSALAEMEEERADLVTFAARVVMVGFWERVVLPLYVQFVLTYFMPHRVNRPESKRAMANGQFLMISRERYERVGRHERIRGVVLEDVKLAEEVKSTGGRIRLAWAPEMVSTRMYATRKELYEGLTKNIHGTQFKAWRQVLFLLGVSYLFLSPFVLVLVAAFLGLTWWVVAGGILILLTFAKQAVLQRALGAPVRYALTYPLGIGFYLAMLSSSIAKGVGGKGVRWKGRTYSTQ